MMSTKIFVNLPVENLQKSIDFFSQLGFSFNQQFTDETATCMIISDSIYVMLLVKKRFQEFTKKPVSDAKKSTEVLIALNKNSREEVDALVAKAVKAGGRTYLDPQDHGFMYASNFEDLDGHQWEIFYMDEEAAKKQ